METELSDFKFTHNILPLNFLKKKKGLTGTLSLVKSPAVFYNISNPVRSVSMDPILCIHCKTHMNPYNEVLTERGGFKCVMCNSFCKLQDQVLASILEDSTVLTEMTVEHTLKKAPAPPAYFFLVDVCSFDDTRFETYMSGVREALRMLPDDALVGLATYGTNIEIYQDRNSYLISGSREYSKDDLKYIFDVKNVRNFLTRKADLPADFLHLKKDPFSTLLGRRKIRCTGSALSLVTSIMGCMNIEVKSVLLFVQGPCTYGPGTITSIDLKNTVRSNDDILKDKCRYTNECKKYYKGLAEKMLDYKVSVSIFGFTMNDFGLYEMKEIVERTGGSTIIPKDFSSFEFLSSIEKYFSVSQSNDLCGELENLSLNGETGGACGDGEINYANNFYAQKYNCDTKIFCSKNIEILNFLGTGNKNQGFDHSLLLNFNTTTCFEIGVRDAGSDVFYMQFATRYQNRAGEAVLRVSTVAGTLSEDYVPGLDQHCMMNYLIRKVVCTVNIEEDLDLIRRIDKILVRTIRILSSFSNNAPDSLELPESISELPNLIYFLRKSMIVHTQANSPDETAYLRLMAFSQPLENVNRFIKPALYLLHYQGGIAPVELDETSLSSEVYLLLDTFTNVLLWRGSDLNSWFDDGLHKTEEYQFLGDVDATANREAANIVARRFPTPKFTRTYAGESQERYLISIVNPSVKENINSEYIDFEGFYDCVKRLVVDDGN